MEDYSKLGSGPKVPSVAGQVWGVQKKRKVDDRKHRPKKEYPNAKLKDEEENKHAIDIKDTDQTEENREPDHEEDMGYQEKAKPRKKLNPKIDMLI